MSEVKAIDQRFDKYESLYTYWETIPSFKIMKTKVTKTSTKGKVGAGILCVIGRGIEDKKKETQFGIPRRHALNSQEILERLKKDEKIEISKTNLYWYLKKMEEVGYLTIVDRVLEGRHKVAYYGRTAKIFLMKNPEKRKKLHNARFNEFQRFVQFLGLGVEPGHIEKVRNTYFEVFEKREEKLEKWIRQHLDSLEGEDFDIVCIMEVLFLLDSINTKYIEILGKIHQALQL